jgi:pimeloyl-ACP methyl ester carboxylesterase
MFERLGGSVAREVAARHFEAPTLEARQEYQLICSPLYNPNPVDPNIRARVIQHHDVGLHWWAGEHTWFDLFPEVGRIQCPTLILAGELDPITTLADAQDLAAAIPQSELVVFPEAGHGVWRDKPEEAIATIREFTVRPAGAIPRTLTAS